MRKKKTTTELIRELTTLPGFKLLLLHVEVSVVQQLKHLRLTRSLSFVAESSVYVTATPLAAGPLPPDT